jgi:hypothetical protein
MPFERATALFRSAMQLMIVSVRLTPHLFGEMRSSQFGLYIQHIHAAFSASASSYTCVPELCLYQLFILSPNHSGMLILQQVIIPVAHAYA